MTKKPNPDRKSPWYDDRLPTIKGVYQTEDWEGQRTYGYWNGKQFMCRSFSPSNAYVNRHLPSRIIGSTAKRWRGLYYSPTQRMIMHAKQNGFSIST